MREFDFLRAEIPLPRAVYVLSELFSANGEDLFGVGGFVRDFVFDLIWRPDLADRTKPKDVDLATSAKPERVLEILTSPEAIAKGIKAFPKGMAFGVISALVDEQEFEIATFREEWYDPKNGDGRRPDKVSFSTPAKDAARRDLTINALFYHLTNGEVRDYNLDESGFGQGLYDLRNKRVRTVGHPAERFREDKLRVLRLIRFFSQYHYGNILKQLDMNTIIAIAEYRGLEGVSPERIVAEFLSGLSKAVSPASYLRNYDVLNLIPTVFPGMKVNLDNIEVIDKSISGRAHIPVLAYLLRDNSARDARIGLNRLKYPNDISDAVAYLLKLHKFKADDVLQLVKHRDLYKQLEDGEEVGKRQARNAMSFASFTDQEEFFDLFLRYEPQIKSENYLHLTGKAISEAMAKDEAEAFRQFARSEGYRADL